MAWSIASRSRPVPQLLADPRDTLASDGERRAGCLGMLRVYARMSQIIQQRIDITTDKALQLGASYGQVAEACGVTRQAVRQRSLRRRQQQDEPTAAQLQAALAVCASAPPRPGADPAPLHVRPVAPTARPTRRAGADAADAKVRVYELAKEFEVESRVVMATMMEMGEFVRSAASTVEPAVVRKLRERFAASGRSQERS